MEGCWEEHGMDHGRDGRRDQDHYRTVICNNSMVVRDSEDSLRFFRRRWRPGLHFFTDTGLLWAFNCACWTVLVSGMDGWELWRDVLKAHC